MSRIDPRSWIGINLHRILEEVSLLGRGFFQELVLDGGRFRLDGFVVKFAPVNDQIIITVINPYLTGQMSIVETAQISTDALIRIYFWKFPQVSKVTFLQCSPTAPLRVSRCRPLDRERTKISVNTARLEDSKFDNY